MLVITWYLGGVCLGQPIQLQIPGELEDVRHQIQLYHNLPHFIIC